MANVFCDNKNNYYREEYSKNDDILIENSSKDKKASKDTANKQDE